MTAPDGVPGLNEAVEAGAVVLAIVKCQGPDVWGRLGENERRIVLNACRGQARAVIEHAVPIVRTATLDEAEKIVMSHADVADPDKEPGMRLAARDIRDLRVRALRTEGQ